MGTNPEAKSYHADWDKMRKKKTKTDSYDYTPLIIDVFDSFSDFSDSSGSCDSGSDSGSCGGE